jgi:Outer membrane protein and related peptidoglycan-associated (lipo)proteins
MKKSSYKLLIAFIVLFCCVKTMKAQEFLPFVNDNYAGVSGVHLQPASIADSRFMADFTLMGFSFNTFNNYMYIDKNYWGELKNHSEDWDITKNFLKRGNLNGKDKFLYQDLQLDILNFMYTLNPCFSMGFTSRIREHFNVDNVTEDLANLIYSGFEESQLFNTELQNSNVRMSSSVWAEYGLSFAGVVYKSNQHVVKAGMNVKMLQGLGSAYIFTDLATYKVFGNDSISIQDTRIKYGTSDNFDVDYLQSFTFNNVAEQFSPGFDLGIVYEWRPFYNDHLFDMDGKTNMERRDENKYKLKVGVSLTDLGFIKYKKGNSSHDFYVNGNMKLDLFEGVEGLGDFNNVIDSCAAITDPNNPYYGTFVLSEDNEEYYKMSLPTALSLQVDYNIARNFYVNFTPFFALKQGNTKYSKVHSFTSISVTPRYETAHFGASVPLQYNQMCGLAVGAGLRIGPLWIGSNNVVSTLAGGKIKNANVQVAIKMPIAYRRVKDKDGDGVSDEYDRCKRVPGPLSNCGCPEPDRDNDGVSDRVDDCPDVPGLAFLKGCPDFDNDSIADRYDDCPRQAGLPQFNGCPDTDADGIPDPKDDCPELPGTQAFNGCPDTDGDGVPDQRDKCPEVKGKIELNGCPPADSDNDGIPDSQDDCPYVPGLEKYNGCPDSDNDGVSDQYDECPTVKGLEQYNGCPDTDGDGLPDQEDECPEVAGLQVFFGCPDTDGDGVPDHKDECPEEKGSPDNNGCPVYVPVEFSRNIHFKINSAELQKESMPYLNELYQLMNEDPNCWVKLEGHTDNTGSDAINNKLSQQRVDVIKSFLVNKGIAEKRIVAVGHGSSKPIAPNDTPENRAKNRRTEINIAH